MNSIAFLLVKSAKNSLLELFHKPAKLILWIFLLAMVGGVFIISLFTNQIQRTYQDIIWLKGVLFLLILLFMAIAVQKGLSNGDAIFDMGDVNLLFVSPVNSRLILIYGIVRMAKMAFLAGFFILFQSNTLRMSFGVGFDGVLITLLGFILSVGLLQIISLLIYSQTNGRPGRKTAVRLIAVIAFLPLAAHLGVGLANTGAPFPAMENTLRSAFFSWTPIAGWAAEGTVSLIAGDTGRGLLFLGTLVLTAALLMLYVALSNPDYYEDVLVATETTFEKKRNMSEGRLNTEASSTRKVKVSKTGIGGIGASAIFYKHLRESFRANRFGLWGVTSVLFAAGAALFSLFTRNGEGGIITLMQILMWVQVYMIGTGRGLKELYVHYIYLIPDSSFSKIIWSNVEIIFRVLVESIVIYGVAGFIMGEHVLLIAASVVVYTLFSFLLLGINYVSLRWTGADISEGMMMFIYTIAVVIVMVPGLIAAIAVGSQIENNGFLVGMGILGLWELLTGMGCFALSRGILHDCDMPAVRTTGKS